MRWLCRFTLLLYLSLLSTTDTAVAYGQQLAPLADAHASITGQQPGQPSLHTEAAAGGDEPDPALPFTGRGQEPPPTGHWPAARVAQDSLRFLGALHIRAPPAPSSLS
ncbi:hypothetical protein C7H85_08530 [Zobellella endophytica]|uniref:Uncharacterized protein n=1 Tax=Zobellella endophytica TaxID=2116700 RepID=A0A2P7R8X0_9GAMM|nr:hypothetical protein [Zobellella endophytica]PSJ46649.1 hypothetical protein C7H85_08530 [Zobellella endophytica]